MSEDTTRNLPGGDMGEVLSILRSIDGRLTSVETRLAALEDKVESRLHDTRPIWEQVLNRLTKVEERLTKVEERLGKLEDEFFWFGRNFRNWTRELSKLQDKYEDLEERLEEVNPKRPS